GELNVFYCFVEELQPATILLEKSQPWPIDLTVNQQTHQSLVTKDRREGKFALGAIKGRAGFAQWLTMNARHFLIRRVAHSRVIAVEIERSHRAEIIARGRSLTVKGGSLAAESPAPKV